MFLLTLMKSYVSSALLWKDILGFQPQLVQTKDYNIDICHFCAKHATLRSKSKDWLALNQYNVSEWSDMSTHRLLFQKPL